MEFLFPCLLEPWRAQWSHSATACRPDVGLRPRPHPQRLRSAVQPLPPPLRPRTGVLSATSSPEQHLQKVIYKAVGFLACPQPVLWKQVWECELCPRPCRKTGGGNPGLHAAAPPGPGQGHQQLAGLCSLQQVLSEFKDPLFTPSFCKVGMRLGPQSVKAGWAW